MRHVSMVVFAWLAVCLALFVTAPALANGSCGGHDQRECTVLEQIPSCDKGLTAKGGRCYNCGGEGEIPCAVTVQVPSCDPMKMEKNGVCTACGGQGQPVCAVTVLASGCTDGLITDKNGQCVACGGRDQEACRSLTLEATCDSADLVLTEYGQWWKCVDCGLEGNRVCPASSGKPQCVSAGMNAGKTCQPCGGKQNAGFNASAAEPICIGDDPATGASRDRCHAGFVLNKNETMCDEPGSLGFPTRANGTCNHSWWPVDGWCLRCEGEYRDEACPSTKPSPAPAPAPTPAGGTMKRR